ncbi:MAG: Yip1 family protein [Burkholderiales bacterium]
MLGRAFRVTFAPEREWGAIARDRPAALGVLVGHVLPLAAIPAVAWMIGLAAFGLELVLVGEPIRRPGPAAILHAGVVAYLGSIVSVALLAGAFALLAPMYGGRRDWGSAWTVAAFGSTPLWLAGVMLLKPAAFIAMLPVVLYVAYLYHRGLHALGLVRKRDAAECVAIAFLLLFAASTLLGGLLGRAGFL